MIKSRSEILAEASRLTTGERNEAHGDPRANMRLAAALKQCFRTGSTRRLSLEEQEAVDMALTKIARIASGSFNLDDYVDGAAYLAIAGEMGGAA